MFPATVLGGAGGFSTKLVSEGLTFPWHGTERPDYGKAQMLHPVVSIVSTIARYQEHDGEHVSMCNSTIKFKNMGFCRLRVLVVVGTLAQPGSPSLLALNHRKLLNAGISRKGTGPNGLRCKTVECARRRILGALILSNPAPL